MMGQALMTSTLNFAGSQYGDEAGTMASNVFSSMAAMGAVIAGPAAPIGAVIGGVAGALAGAMLGAQLGSVVPLLGTAIGAAAGLIVSDEDIDMGSVVERYLSLTSEMGQKTRQWDKGIGLEYMEGRIPGLESEKAFDKSHGDQLATAKGASAELMGEFESERNRAKQKACKALFDENENYSQMLKTANDPTTPDKERWTAQAAIARMLKEADATAEQTFKFSEIYR